MNGFPMRKSLRSRIAVLAVIGAAWVLTPAAAMAVDDTDAKAKALIQLDGEWSAVAATRDAERVASFYAEDAIAYPPGEPVAVGRAAAQKVWAAYFADPSFSISWKTLHAEVSDSGELGFTAGSYRASYAGPDGKQVNEQGKFLCTWKLQSDGTWKAIHDMWNTDAR